MLTSDDSPLRSRGLSGADPSDYVGHDSSPLRNLGLSSADLERYRGLTVAARHEEKASSPAARELFKTRRPAPGPVDENGRCLRSWPYRAAVAVVVATLAALVSQRGVHDVEGLGVASAPPRDKVLRPRPISTRSVTKSFDDAGVGHRPVSAAAAATVFFTNPGAASRVAGAFASASPPAGASPWCSFEGGAVVHLHLDWPPKPGGSAAAATVAAAPVAAAPEGRLVTVPLSLRSAGSRDAVATVLGPQFLDLCSGVGLPPHGTRHSSPGEEENEIGTGEECGGEDDNQAEGGADGDTTVKRRGPLPWDAADCAADLLSQIMAFVDEVCAAEHHPALQQRL